MNTRMLVTVSITLSIVSCVFLLSLYFDRPTIYLVANSVVPVYSSLEQASSSLSHNSITDLEPDQAVEIIQCIDVKHYQLYKIRLPNGQIGFVDEGRYVLIRDGKPSSC
ncbi:hypothetical protein [Gynuella sp.]|uniref:hypothetical protein n=1 Tax=Gynuella sp. TaxID=2969146 RepID=UPI003D0F6D60